MQFLTPALFGLAILAIPILLLYMLKLRRQQVLVSSTLLWERLLRDQQANTPWQKLKRNLLLFLQLLILAALVLSLARPVIFRPVVASGSLIVLLDASASMNATDVSPSRFEQARRHARELIGGLSGDARLTLILVAQPPQTLASAETDKAALYAALESAQPTQGSADWQAAFALAAGASQGSAEVTSIILSDGALNEAESLPTLAGQVRYVPVGSSDDNLALTALALRPAAGGPQLFAEVTNFSAAERQVLLSIYVGDSLITARQLTLAPAARENLTLEDLSANGIYEARLTPLIPGNALDAFPLDNRAYAIYQGSAARRVLLVSSGNLFLEQVLASLPGIQPFRAIDGKIPAEPFDLYVLDGPLPAELPQGNLLMVNPDDNPLFAVGDPVSALTPVQVRDHALTRYLDWKNVHILQAKSMKTPAWADSLVEAASGPLVFAGETSGRRVAALTFDLHDSDLPLQIAFPILFSNLINFLAPPAAFEASLALAPGSSLRIQPPPGTRQMVIASPSGQVYNLPATGQTLVFAETRELGFYAVNFLAEKTTSAEYFAVNLFNPAESDIRPRPEIQIGQTTLTPAPVEQAGQFETWPYLAALALLLLIIEWLAYHISGLAVKFAPKANTTL